MARVPAVRPGAILLRASGSTRISPGGRVSRRAGSLCAGRVVTASGALAGQLGEGQSARTCQRGAEEHHWTVDPGRLKAELTGWPAQSSAGGRVTERDLNYVEDSTELFYERVGQRYEIYLKRLTDPLPE